jgi:hypothetical protein
MVPSTVPCAIATPNPSNSPPIRKLAGRLLGCTCAAALWLNASADELSAHEGYSYHLKEHQAAPRGTPAAQQGPCQIHTKRRHIGAQGQFRQKRAKNNQSAKQESHSKTARNRRPEAKNATKAPARLARSEMSGRGSQKTARSKSRNKVGRHHLPETKAARSKLVPHSRSATPSRGNLKAAHAKSHKTLERRHPKAVSDTRKKSKFAGPRHSAASTRISRSTRAAADRRSRIEAGQRQPHQDKVASNQRAPTRSAKATAVPLPSPRPTRPAPVNDKTVAIPGPMPEAANVTRTEGEPVRYPEPNPANQIPQPLQPSDRAAILERDRLGMHELPKELQELMPNNPSPAQEVVNEARAYLVRTSFEQRERCVGDTMARQGVEVAIGRLHPVMAVRVARSIDQARNEGIPACVYSAFRPPAFGVGGFSDKYNSAHAYGIAVDFGGIDRPGSRNARRFQEIAASNGLYSLYGPGDRAEWNHYQLIPVRRIAPNNPLRATITANGPKDEVAMWIKSGVPLEKVEPVAIRAESAIISTRTKVSHHDSDHPHHRRHMATIKVARLSPFVRVQHTAPIKVVPLSPYARVM